MPLCHPQQRSIKHTPWITTVPHSHKTLQTQPIRGAQTHHYGVCAKFVCMSPDQLRIYITGYVSTPVIACCQPSLTFHASHEILQRWIIVLVKLANHTVINFTLSPVHQNLDRRISRFALSSEVVQGLWQALPSQLGHLVLPCLSAKRCRQTIWGACAVQLQHKLWSVWAER